MHHQSHSETETGQIASDLAKDASPGNVYCLYGDLGAGKTVFARAFIQSLTGAETEVPSPTFTLVQTYDTSKGPLYHFDLYRIQDPEEIYELGWDDALSDGIVLIEWPQRLGHALPARRTDVTLNTETDTSRKIDIDVQAG